MNIDTKIDGWHLPSDDEYTTLSDYLGGESTAGEKMKVGGVSGFNALYAGNQSGGGVSSSIGSNAHLWSSTSDGNGYAWYWELHPTSVALTHRTDYYTNYYRFSVRLLKD